MNSSLPAYDGVAARALDAYEREARCWHITKHVDGGPVLLRRHPSMESPTLFAREVSPEKMMYEQWVIDDEKIAQSIVGQAAMRAALEAGR